MPSDPSKPSPDPTSDSGGGIDDLHRLVREAMPADRPRFRGRLRGLVRSKSPSKRAVESIRSDLVASAELFAKRKGSLPRLTYPQDLPVSQRRNDLLEAIRESQVVVVCGETGSGKTTQLPKLCLELGRGIGGLIGHTQPRRVAARTVAARIAEELGTPGLVASKMRFDDRTDDRTLVKVMTDGVLLAETRSDPRLHRYDTIIVDEAHERSLNIDFLLGFLKRLLPQRPDLKLIITSATIDADRFAEHFESTAGPAPIVEISGRTYPVETRYSEPAEGMTIEEGAADAAVSLIHEHKSDVLVFMPGEREIRQTAHALRQHPGMPDQAEIVPLYARLSPKEQQRVFKPSGHARVVIATNVAETSLTVPNIRAVVDPGLARIKRYSTRAKIDQLLVEPISQASANQRAGRCGRIAPGVCVRMFSEVDFKGRDEFTLPELLRSDLAGVILQMADLGLGEPEEFPFLDAPVRSRWRDGYGTLVELGAIDERNTLTDLGKRMARLPVDPRLARMILAGQDGHCLHDVLVIASAMSVQDPRVRPHEKREAADQAHAEFRVPGSDFLTLRGIWDWYHEERESVSRSKLRRMCEKRYLSPRRIDEWREVFRQIARLCREMRFDTKPRHADADDVHKAVLAGLLINVGKKGEEREYVGTRNTRFAIAPGSAAGNPRPKWVMAGEIVRTSRVFGRTVAAIKPEWIERAAEHLVKRSYSDPRWDERGGRVIADEKVVFEGLELIPKRTVHYGPIDPVESRRLFIHHAFVEGELKTRSPSIRANRKLEDRVWTLQAKARRTDFIADAEARFAFYDARIPPKVFTAQGFERWASKAEASDPDLLRMTEHDLVLEQLETVTLETHPDRAEVFGTRLKVRYELAPGEDSDGATVRITPEDLHRLRIDQAEWLVPGFVPDRVRAWVRSLPKHVRRRFSLDDLASEVAAGVRPENGPLRTQVAAAVSSRAGVRIDPAELKEDSIPDHLRVRFEVIDGSGRILGTSRDLSALRRQFEKAAHAAVQSGSDDHETDEITPDSFEGIPESVDIERPGKQKTKGFPALVLEGNRVAYRVRANPWTAERESRVGLGALFGEAIRKECRIRVKQLPGWERLAIYAGVMKLSDAIERVVMTRVGLALCVDDRPLVRTRGEFEKRCVKAWDRAVPATQDAIGMVSGAMEAVSSARVRLADQTPEAWRHATTDIEQQLSLLTHDGWACGVPTRWLRCFPRYIRAIDTRMERLRTAGPHRDLEQTRLVYRWIEQLIELARDGVERGPGADAFTELRWMVEEYRVAVFAQELGTSVKVSPKRLEDQVARVKAAAETAAAGLGR